MVKNKFVFEKKAYNEDASAEEIRAIKENVVIYESQVIYYRELPVSSPFSINLMFDEVEKYSSQFGKHGLVIDIRNSKRPNASTRREINKRFSQLSMKLSHISFCSGKNFLVNTAAQFVSYQANFNSFTVNKTIEAAINAVKDNINK